MGFQVPGPSGAEGSRQCDSMSDFSSLHSCEALFHTFSDASAAHKKERYRKILQCVGPCRPSDVLHDQSRLVISWRQRRNFNQIQRITVEATHGLPLHCVDKQAEQAVSYLREKQLRTVCFCRAELLHKVFAGSLMRRSDTFHDDRGPRRTPDRLWLSLNE
ncbi:uncharacterized protein V6R79_004846 [Siganus canaliculatus]